MIMRSQKNIIIHCHIFKNGGSTIDDMLVRNFGSSAKTIEGKNGRFVTEGELANVATGDGVKSISSHKLGLPLKLIKSINLIPLIMVREPLDRLGSIYSFYSRQKKKISHECILSKQMSFKGFVKVLMESGNDNSFSNLQSQFFLANLTSHSFLSEKTWTVVADNFKNIKCVGLLERFDESLTLWESYLRNYFPEIDLAYTKKNISSDRESNLSSRLGRLERELGRNLVAEFRRKNEFDYKLYILAKNRIEKEMSNSSCLVSRKQSLMKRVGKLLEIKRSNNDLYVGRPLSSNNNIPVNKLYEHIHCGKYKLYRIEHDKDMIQSEDIQIIGCGVFDYKSQELLNVVSQNQYIRIAILVKTYKKIVQPIVGFTVKDSDDDIIFAMNSFSAQQIITSPVIGKCTIYFFDFRTPQLNSGLYSVTPAFASGTQQSHILLSCIENSCIFAVSKITSQRLPGVICINDFTVLQSTEVAIDEGNINSW